MFMKNEGMLKVVVTLPVPGAAPPTDATAAINQAMQKTMQFMRSESMEQKDITLDGHPGKEVRCVLLPRSGWSKGRFIGRYYFVSPVVYEIVYSGPKISDSEMLSYFDTFKITGKPSALSAKEYKIERTEYVGGAGGRDFMDTVPGERSAVGFYYRFETWAGRQGFERLTPVFDYNVPKTSFDTAIMARDRYVVVGLEVDADAMVRAVRIIFARRLPDGSPDMTDSYTSDWIGQRTGKQPKKLQKDGAVVIGTIGRKGAIIDALGLMFYTP